VSKTATSLHRFSPFKNLPSFLSSFFLLFC
jgi:hypothetical protein